MIKNILESSSNIVLSGILHYLEQNGIDNIYMQRNHYDNELYLNIRGSANIYLKGSEINLEIISREIGEIGGTQVEIKMYDFDLVDPEIFDKILKVLLENPAI